MKEIIEPLERVSFNLNGVEVNMNLVDGEIRIYADGTLKVVPWATNSIRLSIDEKGMPARKRKL